MKRAALLMENGRCVGVKVATHFLERGKGLSDQKEWDGIPLLFPFRRPCRPAFWMHRMHFPLDLIWVAKGRIVGIIHNARPAESKQILYNLFFLKRYSPPQKVDMVVEMLSGDAARLGFELGQQVSLVN